MSILCPGYDCCVSLETAPCEDLALHSIMKVLYSSFFLTLMKTLEAIASDLEALEFDDKALDDYKNSFDAIVRKESPDAIEKMVKDHPDSFAVLAPLLAGSLFMLHRFQDIYDLLSPVDLSGASRHLDYFNGKLIKYYYQSLKYLDKSMLPLHDLLASNREYGNTYSTAVLTNCILDYQVNSHIYQEIDEPIVDNEERSRYCFYHGVIKLVKGDYAQALTNFDECDILNRSVHLESMIKKHVIVTKLLVGDYSIFYPFRDDLRPYFSLIGAVRRAEVDVFYRLLEEHRDEYFRTNLYFVIRRLIQNLIQEGLRKIAVCYSRIRVCDINRILGVNAEYLVYKTIREGVIHGYLEDGIFCSLYGNEGKVHYGECVRKAIEVRNTLGHMIRYPEIVPLTYEKVFENELKKDL